VSEGPPNVTEDANHRAATSRRRARGAATRLGLLLAGGAFVGYVATAVVASFAATGTLTGRPSEPVETRAYIEALLSRDAARLAALQPQVDLGTRAAALQESAIAKRWTANAVSYLGGATDGPLGIYIYVLDVTTPDGATRQTVPFAFTVLDRKIVRVQ
jgi:hypothetical protein